MTMRTREAPMEWEREHDRDLPNIFNTPQSHDSGNAVSLKPRSAALGSFSSDPGQPQRDSSFASQGSFSRESSFTTGWGSASESFRQESGYTTQRQGSFSSHLESRPQALGGTQSPSLSTRSISPGAVSNVPRSGILASSTTVNSVTHSDEDDGHLGAKNTTSFDMGSLGEGILGQGSSRRSPVPRLEKGSSRSFMQSSTTRSNHLRHRSNTAPSSFWSDDDEQEDDQDFESTYDSDDGEHDYNSMSRSARHRGQRMPKYISQGHKNSQKQMLGRSQSQMQHRPQSQPQQHPQRRVWSENVDLPYILSGYVQVAMNIVVVGILIYIMANFIITIQNDVSMRTEIMLEKERKRIAHCATEYQVYHCDADRVGSAVVSLCENLKACMNLPDPRIERSAVAAETFAQIVNTFVHNISYKTMGFVMVLVFGGLYFSNHAISAYRSNHVMHHQHSIVPPSGPPRSTDSDSRTRADPHNTTGAFGSISGPSKNTNDYRESRNEYRIAGRGNSFASMNERSLTFSQRGRNAD